MENVKKLIRSYETWVQNNPSTISDVETTAKWMSYFIAGRISDSNIVSELIYSLSNMMVLYNDRIIDKSRGTQAMTPITDCCYRLKVILTTLEYTEVFVEISAKRVFGSRGKWIVIAILQIIKSISRLYILKYSSDKIVTSPTIPSLNRKQNIAMNVTSTPVPTEHKFTFQLKRSGRIVRKVEGAPPIQYRDFKLQDNCGDKKYVVLSLLHAEYLYIAKPLIHLATVGLSGDKRWQQYVVALAIDIASIHLYYKNRKLMSKQQKMELSRRCLNVLLYLMRSPFYDKFTQSRLERVLSFIANHVPIVKMIAAPLKDYIPHWQDTYFYLWST